MFKRSPENEIVLSLRKKTKYLVYMQKYLENVYHVIRLPVDFHLYIPLDMRISGEVQLPEIV